MGALSFEAAQAGSAPALDAAQRNRALGKPGREASRPPTTQPGAGRSIRPGRACAADKAFHALKRTAAASAAASCASCGSRQRNPWLTGRAARRRVATSADELMFAHAS